jgi:hypothetical protein
MAGIVAGAVVCSASGATAPAEIGESRMTGHSDHSWANLIIASANEQATTEVVRLINMLIRARKTNQASVIVACTQILAQCITLAPSDVAAEVRIGIMGLIDDFAMRIATSESGPQQSGEST